MRQSILVSQLIFENLTLMFVASARRMFLLRLVFAICLCTLGVQPFFPNTLYAIDPQKAITQLAHDIWQREQGLPSNSILELLQTSDGYIWIGTFDGLVRFDGISFTVFNKNNTPALKNNGIWALCETEDSTLWIGSNGGGVSAYKDGIFKTYTTSDGLPNNVILDLCPDKQGGVWIGTRNGLARFSNGTISTLAIPDSTGLHNTINALWLDSRGVLWLGTPVGLCSYQNAQFRFYTPSDGVPLLPTWTIYEDHKGTIWFGTGDNGVYSYRNGTFAHLSNDSPLAGKRIRSLITDDEDNLWVGTFGSGLYRVHNGDSDKPEFSFFSKADGLTDDQAQSLLVDREGNLWLGTYRGGLNRFKNGKFLTYTVKEGLSDDIIYAIYEDQDGSFWIGTSNGLNHFRNGKITVYNLKDGLPDKMVRAGLRRRDGSLWFATYSGLCKFVNGRFVCYSTNSAVGDRLRCLHEDKTGMLWVGGAGGVYRLINDTLQVYSDKRLKASTMFITETRDGSLWFGMDGTGLIKMNNDSLSVFTSKDGLASDVVFCLHEGDDSTLWLGTNSGLNRLKNNAFTTYTTANGMPSDVVFFILPDDKGTFWIGANNGVSSIDQRQLNDIADGKPIQITARLFNKSDGMKTAEVVGAAFPCKSRDKRLWVPTNRGIVVINPSRLDFNTLIPPVKIEHLGTEKTTFVLSHTPSLSLPPDVQRFEFRYAALSYTAPERTRFKVRLEGFDKEWIDVGSKREYSYTNLAPKQYVFRVIACNNDGIWNDQGAALMFRVEPHFYETTWFFLMCGVTITLTSFGAYSWRVRQLASRQKELERLVEERTKALEDRTKDLQREKELTEQQREIAQEASEFKTELLGVAANELKTPLASIHDFTGMLLNGEIPLHLQVQYLNIISDLSNRMSVTVDKLLDANILGVESLTLNKRDISLKGLVELAVLKHQELASKKMQKIELDVKSNCIVFGDEDRLVELVRQLLSNAVKFSPYGKTIWVSVGQANGIGRVEIKDEGPGLSEEDKILMFRKFQKLSAQPTGGEASVGLGLSIVKRIAELHGGKVWAESAGKGNGSTFIFELPAVDLV